MGKLQPDKPATMKGIWLLIFTFSLAFLGGCGPDKTAVKNTGSEMSEEKKIWDWFESQKAGFEKKYQEEDFSFISDIGDKIAEYNPNLSPEVGVRDDGKLELAISCNGISDYIPAVEKLVDAAPPIDGWVITKFRQAKGDPGAIEYMGKTFNSDYCRIAITSKTDKVDIIYYIKGYNEDQEASIGAGFLLLDAYLGEYNVMTKIGVIEFEDLDAHSGSGDLITLPELKDVVDAL